MIKPIFQTRLLYTSFCITLFIFAVPTAYSFEGYEHRYVGDKAYVLATDMAGYKCPVSEELLFQSPCSLYFDNGKLKDNSGEKTKYKGIISYGEIVERIDYMLTPSDMFAQRGDVKNYPLSTKELNPNFFGSNSKPLLNYFRASHNNDAHFQSLLLSNQRDWHQRALAVSRECIHNEGGICKKVNLLGALIINAASDHYLHDYFAPGHIASARYNTPDVIALSIHDAVNLDGAKFYINHLQELDAIIAFIEKNNYPKEYGIEKSQIDRLKEKPEFIYLHGDGYLEASPLQVAYMIIVETQSIREIYASSTNNNTKHEYGVFNEYRWQHYNAEIKNEAEAGIRYGGYQLDQGSNKHYGLMFNISLGRDTLALPSETQHRTSSDIDLYAKIFMGSPDYSVSSDGKSTTSHNVSFRLGVSYLDDEDYSAFGPRLMLSYDFPLLESRVGAYVRGLNYQSTTMSENKIDYGAIFEVGFSLFKANLALGRGWGITEAGEMENGNYFTLGLTFSFPLSRAPGLKHIEKLLHSQHSKPLN